MHNVLKRRNNVTPVSNFDLAVVMKQSANIVRLLWHHSLVAMVVGGKHTRLKQRRVTSRYTHVMRFDLIMGSLSRIIYGALGCSQWQVGSSRHGPRWIVASVTNRERESDANRKPRWTAANHCKPRIFSSILMAFRLYGFIQAVWHDATSLRSQSPNANEVTLPLSCDTLISNSVLSVRACVGLALTTSTVFKSVPKVYVWQVIYSF